jgi:hypothetical protein
MVLESMATSVDYRSIFAEAIAALHAERRYRVLPTSSGLQAGFPMPLLEPAKGM